MTTTTTAAKPSSGLRAYLITRILLVIPMVWVLVTLVFFVMRVVGDPIEAAFGGKVTPQDLANRRHAAGPGPAAVHAVLGLPHGHRCTSTSASR